MAREANALRSGLNRVSRLYSRAVEALSFSGELYRLRRELNARIDQPESIEPISRSHPLGVTRWYKRRRISIAEAYLRVVSDLESRHSKSRLRALKAMVEVSFHAKTLDMPLNTARVQMALVKEAVKNRGDRRRQLELLQDFSESSHGQYQVIRRLLDELNLIELPENGLRLSELGAGWDRHVHDTATSGRKNATQLLIDAFIKGISSMTFAYGGASSLEAMEEAVEAGRIVGIKVELGIEFSLYRAGRRFHFMAVLPEMRKGEDVGRFFEANGKKLRELLEGLEENQKNRVEAVRRLVKNFNETDLGEINEDYPEKGIYRLPKLKMRDLEEFVPPESVNRMHLGDFLHAGLKPVLFNRVLLLKVQSERAARDLKSGRISEWDYRVVSGKYSKIRMEYVRLSPEILRRRYFGNPVLGDYASVFDDLERLSARLAEARCAIKVLHPLEHGLDKALELLEGARGLVDQVEIYNMQDSVKRDPDEIARFCRAVNELNLRSAREGRPGFLPVCGSDATGRSPEIPGMGFVFEDKVTGRRRKAWLARHVALPTSVARMVTAGSSPIDLGTTDGCPRLFSMGKISEGRANKIGDESEDEAIPVPLHSAIRYVNPGLSNLAHVIIGFAIAQAFVGPWYAILWLSITGFRNTIADVVATRGTRFREWNMKSVNFDNVARSLFWTGFSVPILNFIKGQFDFAWPFVASGFLYNAVKFFFISGTNGLYLATHNTLRGFDKSVIKANLFRSVLSWPFATVFAPLLNLAGIPSIVQAKIWSDVIAGFIEGGSKYFKILKLRRRDLEEIIPRVSKEAEAERYTAILDLLYLFREEPRTRNSLKAILRGEEEKNSGDTLRKIMARLKPRRPATAMPAVDNAPIDHLVSPPERTEATAKKSGAGKRFTPVATAVPSPLIADSNSPRELLGSAVRDDSIDRDLVDFVLEKYSHEVAVDLTSLVATTLPDLRDWLVAERLESARLSIFASKKPRQIKSPNASLSAPLPKTEISKPEASAKGKNPTSPVSPRMENSDTSAESAESVRGGNS